jgi:hypothetical protein
MLSDHSEPDTRPANAPGSGPPLADTVEPASDVFRRLRTEAEGMHFTVGWLLSRLSVRSFGIVLLLLALVAMAPGASFPVGLIIAIPALQMILGHNAPRFPAWIADRPLPTSYLAALVRRSVPALQACERVVRPRWAWLIWAAKRPVGFVVLLLDAAVTLIPIPFSNIPPAILIALIALAYLEEDGALLVVALIAASAAMVFGAIFLWQTFGYLLHGLI